ncbi:hypothetical protein [Blastochloris viridis]|uniref:Uncharacterized protein n=1 Tax=Blastochloris viridis TaxID=1079 RepID=A0A0H5BHB2_BLAVI|nr:hypothetical protein [Blastochloris viridis]ALK09587.1 hypothetical protein BVIR_1813 [Blastochloris viridis]BAS00525.1 hypothetical protein BV133_2931 [Blastochloris viridis]CUU42250.1 hypothetical protein BVIRIDIS_12580 [Blastochloris viridis]
MLTPTETTALTAAVIDLAAYRAQRQTKRDDSAVTAAPAPTNVMWVPMMMMVLMPVSVPVAGSDRVHAG